MKKKIYIFLLKKMSFIPLFKWIVETKGTQTPVRLKMWFIQKILGFNRSAYWPAHFTSIIYNPQNIYCGIDTSPGYMPGCYIQGAGKIYIGDYTQIASNVGLITLNHDIYNTRNFCPPKDISLGKHCWIGMNTVILPGIELGDFTIIGAGSVVTKSFPNGYCVIAGNPAKQIKTLDRSKCIGYENDSKYNGYVNAKNFNKYRKENLTI